MSFFSGIKNILQEIKQFDRSIYTQGVDFSEVYAKNLALEEEIEARTKELEQANQTIVTLGSVWEMMNSSQPLSNILDRIVSVLHKGMSYDDTLILYYENNKKDEEEKECFITKSYSTSPLVNTIISQIDEPLSNVELPYIENSIFSKSLNEHKIYSSQEINANLRLLFPFLSSSKFQEISKTIKSKSLIIVPLYKNKNTFGLVVIFSPRKDTTDTETNFLTLFANQIELAITIAGLFEEVKKQAVTDPLTGLYNRRYFEENIIKEAERSQRLKQHFSIISMDLDFLKKINDTYGHQYGDIAITTIANVLKKEARLNDIPARIGGEEFNLLLPSVDSNGAMIAAERIRASIEAQEVEKIGHITVSIGVSTFLEHSDRIDELIELADQAMYKSKVNGRNRVTLAETASEVDWQNIALNAFIDIIQKKKIPVSQDLTEEITSKITNAQIIGKNSREVLYNIVDMISSSYNHMYKEGTTKSKIILAVLTAKQLELPKDEIDKLKIAMLLYDIGNIMIPEKIFNKTTPLTEEEKQKIKTHPIIAARDILQPISEIQDIIPIIEKHHEYWNGKGYPNKLEGNEIPILSQIVLLVDAFYAMTQDRPYRNAYSVDDVIKLISEEAGTKWNKKLVDDFIYVVKHETIE